MNPWDVRQKVTTEKSNKSFTPQDKLARCLKQKCQNIVTSSSRRSLQTVTPAESNVYSCTSKILPVKCIESELIACDDLKYKNLPTDTLSKLKSNNLAFPDSDFTSVESNSFSEQHISVSNNFTTSSNASSSFVQNHINMSSNMNSFRKGSENCHSSTTFAKSTSNIHRRGSLLNSSFNNSLKSLTDINNKQSDFNNFLNDSLNGMTDESSDTISPSVELKTINTSMCFEKENEASESAPSRRNLSKICRSGSLLTSSFNNNLKSLTYIDNKQSDSNKFDNITTEKPLEINLSTQEQLQIETSISFERSNKANKSASTKCNLPVSNYVKINLRKKIYSRKGSMRQRVLKRQFHKWKMQKKNNYSKYNGSSKCFKCGVSGHWAKNCPITIAQPEKSLNENSNNRYSRERDVTTFRILDVDDLDDRYSQPCFNDIFDVCETNNSIEKKTVNSLLEHMHACLNKMGLNGFRFGQELVILRILLGVSTLFVVPTGHGKSLCYQIPSVIYQQLYGSVALIISPLISLMQDQIVQSYDGVNGAFLNSVQTMDAKLEILEKARKGEYSFLMISPEAIIESDWLLKPGRLPPISFVCIDEAHCLADWSHHFRPSYLRICKTLRKYLNIKCFLGLSATCTLKSIDSICRNMGISNPIQCHEITESDLREPGYIISKTGPIPEHLMISASMDPNREQALLDLLTRSPFNSLVGGILIYCSTRDQTERLASLIRTSLQEVVDQVGRRRLKWTCAAYHAGQSNSERSRIQKKFMNGQLRVLCATSAFGMGLNKLDLQAVVHFSVTKSFENYVQEIGRVGRKQQSSFCHTFLPPTLADDPREANDLRRHIFSNHIDIVMIKRLLTSIFSGFECKCRSISGNTCSGHIHVIDPKSISDDLDIRPESLATILAYLELDPDEPLLTVLYSGYAVVSVDGYGGPYELAYASQRSLALAGALSLLQTKDLSTLHNVSVNLPELFNRWNWKPSTVKNELKHLEWDVLDSNQKPYRTGINVSFSQWSLWLWIHGSQLPISAERLDKCVDYLNHRLRNIEKSALDGLEQLTLTLGIVAESSIENIYPRNSDCSVSESNPNSVTDLSDKRNKHCRIAHELIYSYFMGTSPNLSEEFQETIKQRSEQFHWPPTISENQVRSIKSTVRDFLNVHQASLHGRITGRCLANIFHGISTPQFPATVWCRCRRYWRAHLDVDWLQIKKIATEELLHNFTF